MIFQVYSDELAADISEGHSSYFFQLQPVACLDSWCTDGCPKHAGTELCHAWSRLTIFDLRPSQLLIVCLMYPGTWQRAVADEGHVQSKWRLWLREKTRYIAEE